MKGRQIEYRGRITRPVMKTHAGKRQPMEYYRSGEIKAACDEFLKKRGLHVGLHNIEFGRGEA